MRPVIEYLYKRANFAVADATARISDDARMDPCGDLEKLRAHIIAFFPEGPARDLWPKWLAQVERLGRRRPCIEATHATLSAPQYLLV